MTLQPGGKHIPLRDKMPVFQPLLQVVFIVQTGTAPNRESNCQGILAGGYGAVVVEDMDSRPFRQRRELNWGLPTLDECANLWNAG